MLCYYNLNNPHWQRTGPNFNHQLSELSLRYIGVYFQVTGYFTETLNFKFTENKVNNYQTEYTSFVNLYIHCRTHHLFVSIISFNLDNQLLPEYLAEQYTICLTQFNKRHCHNSDLEIKHWNNSRSLYHMGWKFSLSPIHSFHKNFNHSDELILQLDHKPVAFKLEYTLQSPKELYELPYFVLLQKF